MITIRQAQDADFPAIDRILDELEVGHSSFLREDFWVAFADGGVVGVANLKDCGSCAYVGAVAVARTHQRRGVASELIVEISRRAAKDIYLYTRIPDFFSQVGFVPASPPTSIPKREIYGCDTCEGPVPCTCLMRPADAS